MKSLSKDELKTLMSKQKGPCISMFMPAYRAGAEIQQNQIRFRNLLREAEEKLIAAGCRAPEAKALLENRTGTFRQYTLLAATEWRPCGVHIFRCIPSLWSAGKF